MVVIQRKVPNCTVVRDRAFYPGITVITDEEYSQFKELYAFKSEVECGNMSVVKQVKSTVKITGSTPQERTANEIKAADVQESAEVIGGLLDITTLRLVKELDKRTQVQDAVSKQITELTSGRK